MAVLVFFAKRPQQVTYTFALVDETGSATIDAADVPGLLISVNSGAWSTPASLGLTVARTADNQLTVSGFTGSETSIRFQYEFGTTQDVYDNASNASDNTPVAALYVQTTTQHTDNPGIALVPNYTPVVAT
jgi:hypothetical protein